MERWRSASRLLQAAVAGRALGRGVSSSALLPLLAAPGCGCCSGTTSCQLQGSSASAWQQWAQQQRLYQKHSRLQSQQQSFRQQQQQPPPPPQQQQPSPQQPSLEQQQQQEGPCRIHHMYVGNIPFDAPLSAVANLFEPYGRVTLARLAYRFDKFDRSNVAAAAAAAAGQISRQTAGQTSEVEPLGFAFVELATSAAAAESAVFDLNRQYFFGRSLVVSRAQRGSAGGGGLTGGGGGFAGDQFGQHHRGLSDGEEDNGRRATGDGGGRGSRRGGGGGRDQRWRGRKG